MKTIELNLKKWGCYDITKKGIWLYTEHDFKLFVPKSIVKRFEGMV